LQKNFAFHPTKAGKTHLLGEMEIILLVETLIIRITLGMSDSFV